MPSGSVGHLINGPAIKAKVTLSNAAGTEVVSTTATAGTEFSLSTNDLAVGTYNVTAEEEGQSPLIGGPVSIEIVPMPTLSLFVGSFDNTGRVRHDETGYEYPSIWLKDAPSQSPLVTKTDTYLTAGAGFTIPFGSSLQKIRVKGESGSFVFPEQDCEVSADVDTNLCYVAYNPANSNIKLPATIQTYNAFQINWKYYDYSSKTWKSAGSSSNKLYLNHSGSGGLETVVDLANRGTIGLGSSDVERGTIATNLQAQFATKSVATVNGEVLKYWGNFSTQNPSGGFFKEDLIKYGDGKCDAWKDLFIATLMLHNMAAGPVYINPAPVSGYTNPGLRIKPELSAQGNPTPPWHFANHVTVNYVLPGSRSIYDPSYGTAYVSNSDMRNTWEQNNLWYTEYEKTDVPNQRFFKVYSPNDLLCTFGGYPSVN